MKILKQKILLALASTRDFLYAREFDYLPYDFLYQFLPNYARSSIRDACGQLTASQETEHIRREQKAFFRLTRVGFLRLKTLFPLLSRFRHQTKVKWRIALLVDDKKPDKSKLEPSFTAAAASALARLGFRRLGRGVYLCPWKEGDHILSLILRRSWSRRLVVFKADQLQVGDSQLIASHLWGLGKIAERYAKFITQAKKLLTRPQVEKRFSNQLKNEITRLADEFFWLIKHDPGFPRQFYGKEWPFVSAKEQYFKLIKRFFLPK